MRHIEIDFSGKVPRITDKYAGEKGEHQAVTLDVIPEAAMSSDEDLAFYYLLFKIEGGLVASRTFNQGEDISVALWGQLTENRNVVFQLIGTNGLETIIAKSPIITLYLGESLEGTVIGIDDNRDSLIAMIGAFNERLTEVEETQVDWEQTDTEAPDYIKNKPTIPDVVYTELRANNGIRLKYKYSEVEAMWNDRVPLCYWTHPVIAIAHTDTTPNPDRFTLYAINFVYDGTSRTTYAIQEVYCYDDGNTARIGSFQTYPFAPIHKIKKYDGTELSISDFAVTLPDYALASALANYYLKTETYSKSEVNELISGVGGLNIEIVNSLPSSGETGTLYFVPKTPDTRDVYDEYMWISNAWEHIGSTDVDLSNYYTKSEVNALIPTDTGDLTNNAGFITSSALSGYATETWVGNQGYITSSALNGYATETWVGQQGYITSADVKYTELKKDSTHFICTGSQLLTRWGNGEMFTVEGYPVQMVRLDTNTGKVWAYAINDSNTLRGWAVPSDADTPISTGTKAYLLDDTKYGKLSGGEIVADNSKFVTGGQVYSEGYLKSIPTASTSVLGGVKVDGTSITIADGVISAQGSSLPTATNDKDIIYWDATQQSYVAGAIDNVITNGNNLSY